MFISDGQCCDLGNCSCNLIDVVAVAAVVAAVVVVVVIPETNVRSGCVSVCLSRKLFLG